jgi:preprotein translocase subunit SecA
MTDVELPSARVRNTIRWPDILKRARGAAVQLGLSGFDPAVDAIAALEPALRALSDAALTARAQHVRAARASRPRAQTRHETFALAREAARRVLGERPYDEQVVAALALDRETVVEMQTGEGKTLAATMPVALQAFAGQGAHELTFNDYLARRDAEWMRPIYGLLGLSVGVVQQGMDAASRRRGYAADITYVTAQDAAFDHLRDQLVTRAVDTVHRPRAFALVDEADSLLIDEARAPLVVAGRVARAGGAARALAPLAAALVAGSHYATDEYQRDVELTDAGIEYIERALGCGPLHDPGNEPLLAEVNCAVHAQVLLRRDVDYIVRDGRIGVVDEFTGRVVQDRHWPDGLQAALEAKEGLEPHDDGQVLSSVTLQRFLRGYPRLCGMTGTARDAAEELRVFYGLEVVVIPTHRPMVRIDHPDAVFTHREAKEAAVVNEVAAAHARGRPVLVGTLTVEESERMGAALRARGVSCQLLNAKHDEHEARIVATAGAPGAVTIATNMAGRGTDIRLGDGTPASAGRVAALGGLYVIGTNRHESHRIDLQLRGRAGRQGDPGESRFFLSLDDDLLVRYGIRRLIPPRAVPPRQEAPIDHPVVRREIARAQRIVEGQNFEIRRTLARFAEAVEDQYAIVVERRAALLSGAAEADIWATDPGARAALVRAAGEAATDDAERAVTRAHLDRLWREHLARCTDLREGIHLVRLGGADPLQRFVQEARAGFARLDESLDAAVLASLKQVRSAPGGLEIGGVDLKGPSATWTYLVNDDPFRDQVALSLLGAGSRSMAIYAAVVMPALFLLWTLVERWARPRRRDR